LVSQPPEDPPDEKQDRSWAQKEERGENTH
jgi:hypothetical protein